MHTGSTKVSRVARCPAATISLSTPENVTAALGYYRAMFDPSRHVEHYAAEQKAAARVAEQPHLYLHGVTDGCLGVDLVKGADQHLPPGSRVEIVDDAGHFLHLEQPSKVNELIVRWIT